MGKEEKSYCEQKCGHCGNKTRMEIVAQHSGVQSHSNDLGSYSFEWQAGPIYQLLLCPACEGITLQNDYYHDNFLGEPSEAVVLYPPKSKIILGMPDGVRNAYEVASKVRSIDPNAYAVLLGRVLDKICEDRKAVGDSLYERISDLAKKNEIPKQLSEIAYSLKDFRNIGAHANLGDLPKDVIPVLDDLCRAMLEYIYTGPQLIKEAKLKLSKLKPEKKKPKK